MDNEKVWLNIFTMLTFCFYFFFAIDCETLHANIFGCVTWIVTTNFFVILSNTLYLDWATWWPNRLDTHYCSLDKTSQLADFWHCHWSPQTRLVSGLHNATSPLSQQDRHVWWVCSPWVPKIARCHPATNFHFPRLRCRGRSESVAWEWAG